MKIAVPVVQGKLCMHFGHCEAFALVDVDEAAQTVLGTTMVTPPPHAPGVLPPWLKEQGADMIIAGGMGQRAQQIFAANDVAVLLGAPSDTPEALALAYLEGRLETGANICDH